MTTLTRPWAMEEKKQFSLFFCFFTKTIAQKKANFDAAKSRNECEWEEMNQKL